MSTLVPKAETLAVYVSCSRDAPAVTLSDGQVVSALRRSREFTHPCFPKLTQAF